MNKIKLPWSLEFIRNSADYVNIEQTQYFEIKSVDRRSRLMLVIILAIFITIMILIIGLRYFKNLSNRERMLAISIFCLILSGVILLMQSFNSVDYSSININFSTSSNNNVHNLNAELKMLKINHAGSFTFPNKSNFIRIISADLEKPIRDIEIFFDDKTFTIKSSKQTTLYIAAISFNESDKNIAVVSDSEQTITSNLSKNKLLNVLHFNDFVGTAPVDIDNYSSKKLTNPEIPYRNVLNEKLKINNDNRKFYAKLCQNLIRKDREFVTSLTEKTSQNVQILVVPIINQK